MFNVKCLLVVCKYANKCNLNVYISTTVYVEYVSVNFIPNFGPACIIKEKQLFILEFSTCQHDQSSRQPIVNQLAIQAQSGVVGGEGEGVESC